MSDLPLEALEAPPTRTREVVAPAGRRFTPDDQAGVFRRLRYRLSVNGLRTAWESGKVKLISMLGTSFVVACTRAFATSRNHRVTAALAACLSGVTPACRIEATNGIQKLRFR